MGSETGCLFEGSGTEWMGIKERFSESGELEIAWSATWGFDLCKSGRGIIGNRSN